MKRKIRVENVSPTASPISRSMTKSRVALFPVNVMLMMDLPSYGRNTDSSMSARAEAGRSSTSTALIWRAN
jgi:hypothetical protein